MRKRVLCILLAALLLACTGCGVETTRSVVGTELTETTVLVWPEEGLASLLPQPTAENGSVLQDDDAGLTVYLRGVSAQDFADYVDACWHSGFSVRYRRSDTSFEADKISGHHLSISLNGDEMCIALSAPPEALSTVETPTASAATAAEAATEAPADETKEAPAEEATEAAGERAMPEDPDSPETETAEEAEASDPEETEDEGADYVLNTNTKKFHLPTCSSVGDIKEKNRQDFHGSREELLAMGYQPCKRCNP